MAAMPRTDPVAGPAIPSQLASGQSVYHSRVLSAPRFAGLVHGLLRGASADDLPLRTPDTVGQDLYLHPSGISVHQ